MMKTYLLKISPVALLALLVLGALPVAEAQTVPACTSTTSATITPTGISIDRDPIQPITGLATVTANFAYAAEAQGVSVTQVPITFTVAKDKPWVDVTLGSNNAFVQVEPGQPTAQPLSVRVQVTVSQDAPAFDKANIRVTAEGGPGACIPPSNLAVQEIKVQAGFYENYQARFDRAIWKTGQNERIQLPLVVDNFGNGPIRIAFATGEGTSGKLNFALPGPQVVESTKTGGESSRLQLPIDVQTPFKNGYENRRDQLFLDVTGTYAFDTNIKLQPLQLQAVVQTQGVYVPGFETVAMIGAVLGSALIARRLR